MPRARQLRAYIVSAIALFVGGMLATTGYTLWRLRVEALSNGLAISAMHARSFEDFLTQSINATEMLTANAPLSGATAADTNSIIVQGFAATLHNAPFLRSMSILDERGYISSSTNPKNVGVAVRTQDYLPPNVSEQSILRMGQPWVGRDFADGQPRAPTPVDAQLQSFIPMTRTVVQDNRTVTLVLALNPDYFDNHMAQKLVPQEGTVDVLLYDGTLLMSTTPEAQAGRMDAEFVKQLHLSEVEAGQFEQQGGPARPTLTAFRSSRLYPFVVVTRMNRDFALLQWNAAAGSLLGVVVPAMAVLALLALTLYRRQMQISEQRAQAARLERINATVFAASADAIVITDGDANIISVNAAFTRITGYGAQEVLGRNPRLLSSGQHGADVYQAMWHKVMQAGAWQGELVNRRKDGAQYDVQLSITVSRDPNGELQHFIGNFTDVTERKQTEQALRLSEERFRHLTLLSSDWYWEQDAQFRFIRIDGELERNTGISAASHVGHTRWELPALNVSDSEWEAHRALLHSHLPFHDFEMRRPDRAGRAHWVSISGTPIFDAQGQFSGYRGVGKDITARKLIEIEVQQSTQLLRGAIDAIDEAFVLYDAQDRLVLCNEKYRSLYAIPSDLTTSGRTFEEIMRIGVERGLYAAAAGRVDEWVAERMAVHRAGNSSLVQRLDDGRVLRVVDRKMPDGQTVGFRVDITDLVHATDAAQEANRAKSRFLATMSHEIRTPMNGILGMAQLLLMPQLKESERQDYARTILTSGQSLMSLLNDILDLSKIESGRFQLESTVFDPVQLMRETQGLFSGSARAKNLQLEHVWTGPAGSRYLGDSHRLRQMLSNLVGNAIKFTAKGQIKVESSLVLSDSSAAVLEFSVSDTGMGIPEDKLGLLFQPFSQTDSSTTRQFGGSGLGLSIVLSLAKMMGGEVGVESQTGIGSRFWFRIRVDPAEAGADRRSSERQELESAQPASSLPHAHVLVAEDNPVNRKVVGLLLSRLGMRISMAHDGQQAVNAVQSGEHIDVVLMDINMPVMDGYAATQRIRQWESENARLRIPIVALTADAFEEDQRRCLVAGMDDFLTKPIAIGALKLALGKWLPKVPPLSQNDFTDEAHGNAPIDLSAALPLIETLSQLLAKNMFDAIPLVKELQRLAAQTAQAQEVDEVAALVKDFNFSLALERLRILATQPWTKAAT